MKAEDKILSERLEPKLTFDIVMFLMITAVEESISKKALLRVD
jgi:hypothetical protein